MLRRALSLLLVLFLFCAALPASAEGMDVAVDEAFTSQKTLKRGDRDGDDSSDVLSLQNRLIELGYLHESADGVYGGNTESAVSSLQRNNNMAETGEASPELLNLLYSGAELVSFADSNEPESVTYRLQQQLALWGFYGGAIDGANGEETTAAIDEFRDYLPEYSRLHPTPAPEPTSDPATSTGYADAAVVVDIPLNQDESGTITQEMTDYLEGAIDFDVYRATVSSGDEGQEVDRVQRRLHQLKYLASVDGQYGENTERAMLYFQKKNGLTLSATADEETQRLLFSEDAVESEEFINAYKLVVDVSDQRVYIYQWNGSDYDTLLNEMICSTGILKKSTATPLGTYQAWGPTGTGEWYWFQQYKCYAKWATRIVGGILFHSVVYSKGKVLNKTSVKKLGRPASHGCIRLQVEDAKWIYDNCPSGTTVVIQE